MPSQGPRFSWRFCAVRERSCLLLGVLWITILAATGGCAGAAAPGTREISVPEFVFGAFGGKTVDIRDVCPSGEADVLEVRRRTSTYLIGVVTLGIYVPHQIRIQCRAGAVP